MATKSAADLTPPPPDLRLFAEAAEWKDSGDRNARRAYKSMKSFILKNIRKAGHLSADDAHDFFDAWERHVGKGTPDFEALSNLREIFRSEDVVRDNGHDEGRSDSRVADIEEWLSTEKGRVHDYLDVGCSEAKITSTYAKFLGLAPEHAHGCDVVEPAGPSVDPATTFGKSTPVTLPYKDASFDLVTAMMSIHHYRKPKEMLREIRRVIRPGGTFIIREHDCRDPYIETFIDIVHALYATVLSYEETPEEFLRGYASSFRRKEDLSRDLIEPAGFKFERTLLPLLGGKKRAFDMFRSYYSRFTAV